MIPLPQPLKPKTQQPVLPSPGPSQGTIESIDLGGLVTNPYERAKSATETQKELMELVQSGNNDHTEEVDMSLAVVEGFAKNFTLKPHQVLGRQWMTERESGKKSGGILGDMGLGKTAQVITRITDFKLRDDDEKDEIVEKWGRTTLVVCPPAVVPQWVKEINRISPILRVKQHHGASRTNNAKEFKKYDVVVTSYQTLSSEHKNRLENTAPKDNDDDSDPDSDDSGIRKALAARAKKAKAGKKGATKPAALFDMQWLRVVLDEAHTIKNRTTAGAKACFDMRAKFRWCLTGTPIQNNVDELFPLIRFLQIRPLNDWDTFSSQISKPIKAGRSGVPMKRLQIVLSAIMLRRLKTQTFNGKPILDLPSRNVEVVECDFDSEELEFYTALVERTDDKLNKMQRMEKNASMMGVLLLLLRLRQACCHIELCMKKVKDDLEAVDPKAAKKSDTTGAEDLNDDADADDLADLMGGLAVKESTCEICQEVLPTQRKSQYCSNCEQDIVAKARQRKSLGVADDAPSDIASSAKVRKLLEILEEVDEKSGGEGEQKDKTIVFSQFTSFLDIIEKFLRPKGIQFTRYDGKMKMDERTAALDKFQKSKTCNVLLISFKAGSTGLNLTAANHVVLMDLWWNPSLEDQAFDRAHRFGQKKDVFIRKLVIPRTVEEKIQALQEKKRELATNALTGAKLGKGNGLRMDELLALFSHEAA